MKLTSEQKILFAMQFAINDMMESGKHVQPDNNTLAACAELFDWKVSLSREDDNRLLGTVRVHEKTG